MTLEWTLHTIETTANCLSIIILPASHLFQPSPKQALKISILVSTTLILSACSSLGGSQEKRAQKLATGIQNAYSIPSQTAQRISPLIIQHADQHDIDPLLIAAVIRQESTYRSQVQSSGGAVGLMQIIPRYWQQRCPGNLYDEATNIACGTSILMHYHNQTDSWPKALAYYNVGPSGYQSNRKMKQQGKKYAKQVKQHQHALKKAL